MVWGSWLSSVVLRLHGLASGGPRLHSQCVLALFSEPIKCISFKFQFWVDLVSQGGNGHFWKKNYVFWFFSVNFSIFVNLIPYGSKNVTPSSNQFESFQTFSEFSSPWSSQKYCFGFLIFWIYIFFMIYFLSISLTWNAMEAKTSNFTPSPHKLLLNVSKPLLNFPGNDPRKRYCFRLLK